jgi:hypothetical protein
MHTKGHIRDFFEVSVEDGLFGADDLDLDNVAGISIEGNDQREIVTVRNLLGLVWHSTDQMPASLRDELKDQMGWDEEAHAYGQAAQRIHRQLGMAEV